MRAIQLGIALLISFCVALGPNLAHAQCHSSPILSTMDRDFLWYMNTHAKKGKNAIAILPFYDNHTGLPDEALYSGFPFFIYDAFISNNAHILHPYLSLKAAKDLSLSPEKLGEKAAAKQIAQKLDVRYVIYGAYQRTFQDRVKIWVNVYDRKSDKALSPAQSFVTPFNDSMMDLVKANIKQAFQRAGSKSALKTTKTPVPSLVTLRSYGQGMVLASHYDLNKLELAQVWLEKALKQSFHKYTQAALNLSRVHFMMSLIQKQNKHEFIQNWNQGLQTLKFATRPSGKISLNYSMTYRYVESNKLGGMAASSKKASQSATASARAYQALKLVPEDGILQNLYLQSLTKTKPKDIRLDNVVCF